MFKQNLKSLVNSVSLAAFTVGLAFSVPLTQKAFAVPADSIKGSGATSIQPLYTNWFPSTAGSAQRVCAEVALDPTACGDGNVAGSGFRGIGSGGGETELSNGTVDFAASDSPTPLTGYVAVNAVNIPVSFIYNLNGFSANLTTADICGVINGTVTNFSQLSSPGPDQPISFYYRSDSSGTTKILNNFTTANCTPSLSVPPFPVGTAVQGSDGIINAVKQNVGAIGYVDTPAATAAGAQIAGSPSIIGPNYLLFRPLYDTAQKAGIARAICTYSTDTNPGQGNAIAVSLGYVAGADAAPGGSSKCNSITP